MEEDIATLSKGLGSFCNHLQTSVGALKQSIDRRPIPLDSASSTFIQSLNQRVSAVGSDLTMLDSMSFGTVSFEELLGHCSEVFKRNQSDLVELEDRLKGFGYVPELDVDDEDEIPDTSSPLFLDSKLPSYDGLDPPSSYGGRVSEGCCTMKSLEDESLCDDYLSLKRLGISDTSLATIASQAKGNRFESDVCSAQSMKYGKYNDGSAAAMRLDLEATEDDLTSLVASPSQPLVKVSKDEFEKLPSFMRTLVSWEELVEAVEKINTSLREKEKTASGEGNRFFQDEIPSLSLGTKARSYLLLLVRMKQLVVETVDGLISYRLLQTPPENH